MDPLLKNNNKFGKFTDMYCFGYVMFNALTRKSDPRLLSEFGKEIFENKNFDGLKELFINDWDNEVIF